MASASSGVAPHSPNIGRNRRRSERRPHVAEAWLSSPTATDASDRLEVTSLNISRHGIAFDLDQPLPVGTFHIVELGVGEKRDSL